MSKELKIGATVGMFVVAASAWFYYSHSSGSEDKALRLNGRLAVKPQTSLDAQGSDKKSVGGARADKRASRPSKPDPRVAGANRRGGLPKPTGTKTRTKRPGGGAGLRGEGGLRDRSSAGVSPGQVARGPQAQKTVRPLVNRKKPGARRSSPVRPTGPAMVRNTPKPVGRKTGATPARNTEALLASSALPATVTEEDADRPSNPSTGALAKPARSGVSPETIGRAGVPASKSVVREHTVQSGESFALIAQKYYGSQRHTSFLIKSNPQVKDPNRLRIGQVLRVPALGEAAGAKSKAGSVARREAEGRTYLVRANDTFYDIAEEQLGDGGRWPEIYERNKDVVGSDPADLRAGQVLELPAR